MASPRDVPQAPALTAGLAAEVVRIDSAYYARHFLEFIASTVGPRRDPQQAPARQQIPSERELCRERHLGECCFSRLNQFRRGAARFEKTARNYLAVVALAATT